MSFKNALWAAGFPEREDAVVSAQTSGGDYTSPAGAPTGAPFMVEFAGDRDSWIGRGATKPAGNSASIFAPADRPTRFEVGAAETIWIRRVGGSNNVTYSVRMWRRPA